MQRFSKWCVHCDTSVWSLSCSVHSKLPFICIHVGFQTSPVHAPIPDSTPLMPLHDCPQLMCIPLPLTVCVCVCPHLMLQRVQWEVEWATSSFSFVHTSWSIASIELWYEACYLQVCKYRVLISIKLRTFSLLSSAPVRIWVEWRDRAQDQPTTRSQAH